MSFIGIKEIDKTLDLINIIMKLLGAKERTFNDAYLDGTLEKKGFEFKQLYSIIELEIKKFIKKHNYKCKCEELDKIIRLIRHPLPAGPKLAYSKREKNIEILMTFSDVFIKYKVTHSIQILNTIVSNLTPFTLTETIGIYLEEFEKSYTNGFNLSCSILLGILSELFINEFIHYFISYWDDPTKLNREFSIRKPIGNRIDQLNLIYSNNRSSKMPILKQDLQRLGIPKDSDDLIIFNSIKDFNRIITATHMARLDRNPRIHPIYFTRKDIPSKDNLMLDLSNLVKTWIILLKTIDIIKKIDPTL